MTRWLEFVRVIYGLPESKMVIVVLYVCQACGWAPQFDYDCYVTKKGGSHVYWCAHCGEQYDKHTMEGAFGFIFKHELFGENNSLPHQDA